MSRPLLFLDVDGPLNPYAAKPTKRPDGYTTLRVPRGSADSQDHYELSSVGDLCGSGSTRGTDKLC